VTGGLAIWWVWVGWGCGSGDPFRACGDLDCRVEVAIANWESDPVRVRGWVESVKDPWARAAVASRVVTAHGMGAVSLCTLLETAPQKARCSQVANRPHLRGGE
jgi:hypothetical protein